MFIGVLVVTGLVLFGLAFMTKRRFGVLGLALSAGALLSSLWANDLVGIVERSGFSTASITTAGLVSAALVIAPALLLLFSGPSYRSTRGKLIGSLLFTVFASALLIEPLGRSLVLDPAAKTIYDTVASYSQIVISAGIVLSLFDLLAIHTSGGSHGKSKGKH